MVTKNRCGQIDALKYGAEAEGLLRVWGGRMVQGWACIWIEQCELPLSQKGSYLKIWSLLDDSIVRAELHLYLHSNKWSMDPTKLQKYSQQKMVPLTAHSYLEIILHNEMPVGLKKYMEVDIMTCHCFLHVERFNYIETVKGVYYNGHKHPNVVEAPECNFVKQRVVLVLQDEMMCQANDGKKKAWTIDGEQPLKKKGQGCGLHCSNIICSTFGWMKDVLTADAGQVLEYGKNYDGY
ncbi:hypothetical protein FISHEDRAFT_47549 [Fistulina hepatica ATCC 64428]|uniref:Uncharacterized protein n=1 Tax=Fistulina hepatica ATCC 64428 TaxID=1128425 RepID=A0A0D7A5H9_9AGAR|nr:hypothetical protein FISHEDRAFT_47549 [Fistulina hepatica ATCC 64428]